MDFRQLRYFVTVAEELSFSAAARRLHVSQPPLSIQVKAIEEELGVSLFNRNKRNVELTEAGRAFLQEARQALAHLQRAGEAVRQVAGGESGEIGVAFTASVPMRAMFSGVLQRFRERHPNARTKLVHMSTGQQLRALSDRTIDVGFLRPSPLFCAPPEIRTVELWQERLLVVLPASHLLACTGEPVSMAALANEKFILFPRGLGCGLFEHVSVLASRSGFAPHLIQEAGEGATILGLVAAGLGISVLPEVYVNTGVPGLICRPLAGDDAGSRVVLAWRAEDDSPLLRHFVGIAHEAVRDSAAVTTPARPGKGHTGKAATTSVIKSTTKNATKAATKGAAKSVPKSAIKGATRRPA